MVTYMDIDPNLGPNETPIPNFDPGTTEDEWKAIDALEAAGGFDEWDEHRKDDYS
jgi:hypothetical protein